ncbi:TPA: hypothetical protein U2C53_000443 [Streptococcus suis]|nr:hypothetical protein [Streptococcus suis]HEM6273724.1 hypothetical protein [Streptococcus suis]HEM6317290.1 hypothetical protein [Streptococcus suis]
MSKQMEYRKQIELIESQLTKENKEYMGRINGYMMIASVFHRQEEAVTAQLLSIYQDVLEAQKDGLSAEDFLGKDSKQMADDLLSYLPPIGFMEVANLSGLMLIIYLGSQWLMEFAGSGTVQFNWLALVCDSLLAFLLPAGIMLLLRNLIYQTSKLKIWATYIGFPLVYVAILAGRFILLPDGTDISLTGWTSLIPVLLIGLALLFFQKEKLVRYVFLPSYLFMMVGGVVNMVMTVPVWLNLVLLILPAMAFWIGTAVLLMRKEK